MPAGKNACFGVELKGLGVEVRAAVRGTYALEVGLAVLALVALQPEADAIGRGLVGERVVLHLAQGYVVGVDVDLPHIKQVLQVLLYHSQVVDA